MAEMLLLYLGAMVVLGLVPALYGVIAILRGRVGLTRRRVLYGGQAFVAGLAMIFVGCAMAKFMWSMVRYFPH